MGDVNLLYETAIENKVRRIKIFKAQIVGETSAMTVAKYENDQEVNTIHRSTPYYESCEYFWYTDSGRVI